MEYMFIIFDLQLTKWFQFWIFFCSSLWYYSIVLYSVLAEMDSYRGLTNTHYTLSIQNSTVPSSIVKLNNVPTLFWIWARHQYIHTLYSFVMWFACVMVREYECLLACLNIHTTGWQSEELFEKGRGEKGREPKKFNSK